jgi:glycosyltransferase involved in cell wall biosynthesis
MLVPPKISIVIPTYNQGAYIEQTITSLLDQLYPDLELIIIDGGSTDATVEIIKKYQTNIAYWVSEKDRGQSHAINKGLDKATGVVFNWINSDDWMEPGSLKILGDVFSNPSVNVLCGRMAIQGRNGHERTWGPTKGYPSLNKTIGFSSNKQPCTFFRLEKLRRIGKVNESLHYTMDQDMWIRYLLVNGTAGIQETVDILSNFRLHEESKTSSGGEHFLNDMMEIFACLALLFNESKYVELFKSLQSAARPQYKLELPKSEISREFKPSVTFNYFLLRYLEMKIGRDSKSKAEQYAGLINPFKLHWRDIRYYYRLKGRIKQMKT